MMEAQAENYRNAIAFLDSCGELTLDKLRETYRIAGVNTPESELQKMWQLRLDLAPSPGRPWGAEALRQMVRDKLAQAIEVFTTLKKEAKATPGKPSDGVATDIERKISEVVTHQKPELDRKISELQALQKAEAEGRDTTAERQRMAAELRALADAARQAVTAPALRHAPSTQEIVSGLVNSVVAGAYPKVADSKILRIESILNGRAMIDDCDKVKLNDAMRVGRFDPSTDWLMYLARVEAGRSDDEGDQPLSGFVFDLALMNGDQRERLDAARVRTEQLYARYVARIVTDLETQAGNVSSLTQKRRRELLRSARQVWSAESKYLDESQKSALKSVILGVWTSISPRWWEFLLRARPSELGPK